MASFAGKNPPWARAASSSVNSGMSVAGQQVAQQVAAQNQVLGQPAVFTIASSQPQVAPQYTAGQVAVNPMAQVSVPHPGIAIPTTLGTSQVGTVSYPAPRPVAPGGPQHAQAPGAPGSTKQRVFTGTVTKLHDNFGFVDDDVFFQIARCVKGQQPRVGDRVLVEASYNSNMPFKWNATRIQVMPSGAAGAIGGPQGQPQTVAYGKTAFGQGGISPANVPPPNITPTMLSGPPPNVHPPPLMGSGAITGASSGFGNQQGSRFGGGRIEAGRESSRDRRDRNRDRRSPSRRQRSPVAPRRRSRSPKERRTSPRRSRSPLRKKPALVIRRYNVQVPKINLDLKDASVTTLKGRYSNMYIPSDFFNASFLWTDAFPLYRPFGLGHYCSFHVMHKEVEPLNSIETVLEPSDADHLFSAKVMLLACPILEDLHHKACALAEDPQETQEAFQHPTRLIQFLVGMKGKSEPMAIGGPWSPSLDGKNPEEDPRVLINTAIRTTRALTGIDLSGCTQWYRFAEIRYHRPEETHKGRTLPARVETVVLFLPDVWSCQPSQIEWETLQFGYKKLLSNKMTADKDDSQEEEMETDGTPTKADPTHYSELDPKNMKVSDLRRELEARTLSSKGLKSQLIARLTKATKSEQEKEEEKEAERKEAEEAEVEEIKEDEEAKKEKEEAERLAKEEEEKKKKEERDRAILERHYTLPPNPAIIVHPSATAKSGKFDCTVMNLSVLLDYRPEDTKEHSFEVSLFAELFNEMLMRDFGFQIYRSLVFAPEKKEEPRKDKEKDKEDKESKKEDKDKKEESEEPAAKKAKTDEKADSKDKDDDDKKKDKDRDKKREREERRKEKVKQYTADPALLLAFVYFDQNHTGYLLDKDCEEILHILGLHLTRSQVKKLVQKMVSRDTLTYRKLTDKPLPTKEGEEGDKKDASIKKDDVKGKKEEPKSKVQEVKAIPEVKAQPVSDEKLAQGNKTLLPQNEETTKSGTPRKRGAKQAEGEEVGASGLVQYNGALVDINNIMSKVESSELTRNKLEAKMKEQQEELDELRKSYNTSEASGQRTAAELSRLQKKLQEQTDKKNHAEKHADEMLRAVMGARGQLEQVTEKLNEVIPKPKAEVKEEPTEEASTSVKKEEPKENGAQ